MNRIEQILGHPEVEEFITTHQGAAARVRRAVELLVEKKRNKR